MRSKLSKTYLFFTLFLTLIMSVGNWVSASDHDVFSGLTSSAIYQIAANADFDLNQPDNHESLSLSLVSEEISHHKIELDVVIFLVCILLVFSPVILENPFNIVHKVIKPPSRSLA